MTQLKRRLARLEQRKPAAGLLPTVLILRPDAPDDERQAIAREYRDRQAAGQKALLVRCYGDALPALVEEFAP